MNIIELSETDSTNNYAKTLIDNGLAISGQVIRAHYQSCGRGQSTNIWESDPGKNLLFSIIFRPETLPPQNQFLISQAVSEGLVKYLESVIPDPVSIKWPNDIYVGLQKISGILIEHTIQSNRISFSVIGIGFNVNQKKFSEQIANPTSLSLLACRDFDLESVFSSLTHSVLSCLDQLQMDGKERTQSFYLEHLLFLNEVREYLIFGKKVWGKIIGVNRFGLLQVESKGGIIFECGLKELVYFF